MLSNANSKVNAIQSLYKNLMILLRGSTIKYTFEAEKYETLESKQNADQYLSALQQMDTFISYNDYTEEEYNVVGLSDPKVIKEIRMSGLVLPNVPEVFRNKLLELRRQRTIDEYEEENNYYRRLAGIPDLDCMNDKNYMFYVTNDIGYLYDIDIDIPIHEIEEYYNDLDGSGTYKLSILEGLGYIETLREEAISRIKRRIEKYELGENKYDEELKKYDFLNYLGSNKISIEKARNAKNFQIIRIDTGTVSYEVYSKFLEIYEQCRDYFVSTIYISDFRNFIDLYDNFIAMCIMFMTIQQCVIRQIPYANRRSFFDIYSVKALYEVYGIPYNLKLDMGIQEQIIQNLNLLIQNKATDKVLFDIASILGLSKNINISKYYLAKQQKFDAYGVPIIKTKEEFNSDTGQIDVVKDYEAMYDIYFQRADLDNTNFSECFDNPMNKVKYETITTNDPFWVEDSNLHKMVWESQYNFVESKYLGVNVAYKTTDIVFKNITLIKLILNNEDQLNELKVHLPKIVGSEVEISIFDAIIALICLLAAKHKLYGEIISIPTQIISVLDYIRNTESGEEYLVDTLGPDLSCFISNGEDQYSFELIGELKELLSRNIGEEEANTFMKYVESISSNAVQLNSGDKIYAINALYDDFNSLYLFLVYMMSRAKDRKTYIALRQMYKAAFYVKEVKSVFNIEIGSSGYSRTAKSFFEYLNYRNPKLYNTLFKVDFQESYETYLYEHRNDANIESLTYDEYMKLYETGEVEIDFSTVNANIIDDEYATDEFIYTAVSHILNSLSTYIKSVDTVNMLGDTSTVLESLFWKLVRFFKSYTTEIVDFSNTIMFDMKADNMFRMFDEVVYMKKSLNVRDDLHISFSDVIKYIHSTMELHDRGFSFNDRVAKEAIITIGKDRNNNSHNKIHFHDSIYKMEYIDDNNNDNPGI